MYDNKYYFYSIHNLSCYRKITSHILWRLRIQFKLCKYSPEKYKNRPFQIRIVYPSILLLHNSAFYLNKANYLSNYKVTKAIINKKQMMIVYIIEQSKKKKITCKFRTAWFRRDIRIVVQFTIFTIGSNPARGPFLGSRDSFILFTLNNGTQSILFRVFYKLFRKHGPVKVSYKHPYQF